LKSDGFCSEPSRTQISSLNTSERENTSIATEAKATSNRKRSEAGAIILNIAYGYTIEPHKTDPLVNIADNALEQFSAATVPGAWMVDLFPIRAYLIARSTGTHEDS
jgi:hypothetical protein